MNLSIQCPSCGEANFSSNQTCRRCGLTLGSPIRPETQSNNANIPTPSLAGSYKEKSLSEYSVSDWLVSLVWVIALIAFGILFLALTADLAAAQSAPQQAAAAAMNIGYVVAIYCGARAITAIHQISKR